MMINQPQPTIKGRTMETTTKTFEDFFTALEDAYAMEIDDTIMLPAFEEGEDVKHGDVVILYDEWNGSIGIPTDLNKEIGFDAIGRTYSVKGFNSNSEDSIETFSIRFLKLA